MAYLSENSLWHLISLHCRHCLHELCHFLLHLLLLVSHGFHLHLCIAVVFVGGVLWFVFDFVVALFVCWCGACGWMMQYRHV